MFNSTELSMKVSLLLSFLSRSLRSLRGLKRGTGLSDRQQVADSSMVTETVTLETSNSVAPEPLVSAQLPGEQH